MGGKLSEIDEAGIERALRDHVLANYSGASGPVELDANDDLLASGQVDSMGVMEIVGFVERTFDLAVEDKDIVPENFRSLQAMTEYVARKKSGSGREDSEQVG